MSCCQTTEDASGLLFRCSSLVDLVCAIMMDYPEVIVVSANGAEMKPCGAFMVANGSSL